MMKAEYLYNHIVHLVHAPIYVYNEQKELAAVYIDNGEQENLFDEIHLRLVDDTPVTFDEEGG